MAKLAAIAITPRRMALMELRDQVNLSVDHGIEGDARGVQKQRQVSVLFAEDWEAACNDLDQDLPWLIRRANFLVNGAENPKSIGAHLQIGDVILEVTEETEPCHLMERAAAGLKAALTPEWRGGVCCRVLEGGNVSVGDTVGVHLPT